MALQKWVSDNNDLYDYIQGRVANDGVPAVKAIGEYCEKTGLPESKVRIEYYKEKSNRLPREKVLKTFSEVITLGEQGGIDITSILESLLPLFKAAVKKDKNDLEQKVKELEAENQKIKEDMVCLSNQAATLNSYLDEFLRLPSLKKIAGLEDFTYNLKIMIDKSGLVQKVERV